MAHRPPTRNVSHTNIMSGYQYRCGTHQYNEWLSVADHINQIIIYEMNGAQTTPALPLHYH